MTVSAVLGRPLCLTALAAVPPGRWSRLSSRPRLAAGIQLICCCAATITAYRGPPWQRPARSPWTRQARSCNPHR